MSYSSNSIPSKHVAIGRVKCRGFLGDIDERIVRIGIPIKHAWDLPARVADTVAGDALHGGNEFVVVDATVVGACHRAKFNATVLDFERLDLFGTM